MPRPRKHKKICEMPKVEAFSPTGAEMQDDIVTMSVEEYEAVRLIDYDGLTQEECAEVMDVARSTIQRIYMDARKKLADCIVDGKKLSIRGGHYTICTAKSDRTYCRGCNKYRNRRGGPPEHN